MAIKKDERALPLRMLKAGKYIEFLCRGTWEFVRRANCTGIVIIVAQTGEGKVLFVEQFRMPVGRNCIEFPAGLVNDRAGHKHESMALAAKRELWEETGYRASRMTRLVAGPVAGGSSSDFMTFYLASGLRKTGHGGGDDTEDIKVYEVPLAEVEDWLKARQKRGVFIDPKIYTGLYFLIKYNNPKSLRTGV